MDPKQKCRGIWGCNAVFSARQPARPASWLASLLKLAGDIEENPGPRGWDKGEIWVCDICRGQINKRQISIKCYKEDNEHWVHLKCSKTTVKEHRKEARWTCEQHTEKKKEQPKKKPSKMQAKEKSDVEGGGRRVNISVIQININGIKNKIEELKMLIKEHDPDVVAVQETKLGEIDQTPTVEGYSIIRRDRDRIGGGVLTMVRERIKFTEIITIDQEDRAQLVKVKLHQKTGDLYISNLYVTPRELRVEEDERLIERFMNSATSETNTILVADINAHSKEWYRDAEEDSRGRFLTEYMSDKSHIIINEDTATRLPFNRRDEPTQRKTAPDITAVPIHWALASEWTTLRKLSSDHLPILIKVRNFNRRPKNKVRTYTNYSKAKWDSFKDEVEQQVVDISSTEREDPIKACKRLTDIIMEADRRNIPRGKIRSRYTVMPENIIRKISERNDLREQDDENQELSRKNEEINQLVRSHKADTWKRLVDPQNLSLKDNPDKYWKTMKRLKNNGVKADTNRTVIFKDKTKITDQQITDSFNKQYTGIAKKLTNREKRRQDRYIRKLRGEDLDISFEEVNNAIKRTPPKKSSGPDGVTALHLKHLGVEAVDLIKDIINNSINKNMIPTAWKVAKIIPVLKPGKNKNNSESYRPISLLSNIAKTMERVILERIKEHLPSKQHQHGYKAKHSTTTALMEITSAIAMGFNKKQPPERSVMVALDMASAFDIVDHQTLIEKLLRTPVDNKLKKYISNYIKGRSAFTLFNDKKSRIKLFHGGVPQGGVLSPILFNLYMADMPQPRSEQVKLVTYADDITIVSSNRRVAVAEERAQEYLEEVVAWVDENKLKLSEKKTQATLLTPDPAENRRRIEIKVRGREISPKRHPEILGVTFDPKLTFCEHSRIISDRAKGTLRLMKAQSGVDWGQSKESLVSTYKAYTRPILEYASQVWSPIISETNMTKMQSVQNNALRVATGCTRDTNAQHLHEETLVLPLKDHIKLHSSQLRERVKCSDHPLHHLLMEAEPERLMKKTIFNNYCSTTNISGPQAEDERAECEKSRNKQILHTQAVQEYLEKRNINKVLGEVAPNISTAEEGLSRKTRRQLAQLRTGKCPLLKTYLNKIDTNNNTSPMCPLCGREEHTTGHLFNCPVVPTNLVTRDLWDSPVEVERLLQTWMEEMGSEEGGAPQDA